MNIPSTIIQVHASEGNSRPVERVGEPIHYSFKDLNGSVRVPLGESKDVVIIHGLYSSEEALRQRIGQIGEDLIRHARATSDVETLEHGTADKLAALGRQIEFDRTKLAEGVTAIKKALGSREWLAESRGPYEYDDTRYQQEFGAAVTEIRQALERLAKIAGDWTSCPRDSESVARARLDLEKKNVELREALEWALRDIDLNDCLHPEPQEGLREVHGQAKAKAREALK